MTEHTEVDLDLLADYIGGALDGTPAADRVGRLVAGDPGWQEAFDSLAAAMTVVAGQLHGLPAAGPMPGDVADRITAALAGLPALDEEELARLDALAAVAGEPAPELEEPVRHLHAVPTSAPGAARRQRRLRRWAAPIAVAAGVLAFAGVAVSGWFSMGGPSDTATSSEAGGGPQVFDAPGASAPGRESGARGASPAENWSSAVPTTDRITVSGLDYKRAQLASDSMTANYGKHVFTAPSRADAEVVPSSAVAPELARLVALPALQACLDAIGSEHGSSPIGVESLDFARFEGTPALIVRFTADDGRWAWASGPGCGTPDIGADTRDHVRVS